MSDRVGVKERVRIDEEVGRGGGDLGWADRWGWGVSVGGKVGGGGGGGNCRQRIGDQEGRGV